MDEACSKDSPGPLSDHETLMLRAPWRRRGLLCPVAALNRADVFLLDCFSVRDASHIREDRALSIEASTGAVMAARAWDRCCGDRDLGPRSETARHLEPPCTGRTC
jgi:hypothetical protein